jgi:hypothetical protein
LLGNLHISTDTGFRYQSATNLETLKKTFFKKKKNAKFSFSAQVSTKATQPAKPPRLDFIKSMCKGLLKKYFLGCIYFSQVNTMTMHIKF